MASLPIGDEKRFQAILLPIGNGIEPVIFGQPAWDHSCGIFLDEILLAAQLVLQQRPEVRKARRAPAGSEANGRPEEEPAIAKGGKVATAGEEECAAITQDAR